MSTSTRNTIFVEDALILMKESDSAKRVFAPKVRGTQVLEAETHRTSPGAP